MMYGAIYVAELLFEHWLNIHIVAWLQLYPVGSDNFYLWQIFIHPLIHHPQAPFAFIISCIVFYFFAGPVEKTFGTLRFLTLFYLSALGGAICGLLFSGVSGFSAPFLGMMPSLLSLIVVFGLLQPEATILLMFILPVKAKYLSYGTIVITALTFLAKVNPYGAYHLGGILFGYLYLKGPGALLDPKLLYFKYLEWQIQKKRARFTIIDGDKEKEEDKKPTIH